MAAAAPERCLRLEVICGCMFAGKTTRLIERLTILAGEGARVLAVKHAYDDRYDQSRLATHDGRRFDAVPLGSVEELVTRAAGVDVLGIDEVHFFGPGLYEAVLRLLDGPCTVVAAGIDFDSWGAPFSPMTEFKRIAGRVDLLTVPCTGCGAPARYSQRVVPIDDPRMVGGTQDYEPRCRACFVPLPVPRPAGVPNSGR